MSAQADPDKEPHEGPEPSPSALPAAVRKRLLRGLGAYLRSTPRAMLPADLRRFAGFRQQGLARHSGDLLDALRRREVSGALLEWLEGEPNKLGQDDAAALRTVAERAEGWVVQLAGAAPASRGTQPRNASPGRDALERERAKATRAREDARRAREESRRSLQVERAKAAELTAVVRELRAELTEARRARGAAERQIAHVTDDAQRDVRRARRERDRARESSDALRRELKQERRRAAALQRDVDGLGRELERLKS